MLRNGYRFRNRFELKNIKIIGEAGSAIKEAASTLLAELKKLINKKDTIQSKSSIVMKLSSS